MADNDGAEGDESLWQLQHAATWVVASEFGEFLLAVDDDEMPRLSVDGCGRSHAGTQHRLDVSL